MEIIVQTKEMQRRAEQRRREGMIIAFVPTMGYLHEGHLSLMREGRKRGDCLVASIFVNPTQFGPAEDYNRYPRDLKQDLKLIQRVGVDICFTPSVAEMYPDGFQTFVEVERVTQSLCGISRPHHFRGVTSVVAKLFNIVKPHLAFFGQKDYQQLIAIKRMVKDLNMDIEVVGMPTIREPDGLAMSSRNAFLNQKKRKEAARLYRSLVKGKELFAQGERSAATILQEVRRIIEEEKSADIDYVKICDAHTLEDIEEIKGEAIIALAVKMGKTRLIDNIILKEE
ncbi:MAG: pantoate--beta-alanine ligase [Deltaproteobacteria bacterium RBG_16_54_11]|nr:MAG: pantoate--beta-alanine ligase [Deltaproteobacteria bacterium RBG_16_54_11]